MKKSFTLIILALLVFAGCNQNSGVGLFYLVENETPQSDSILGENASIEDMAPLGTSVFVSTGASVFKKETGSSWRSDPADDYYSMGGPLEEAGGRLYLIAKNTKEGNGALFTKNLASDPWTRLEDSLLTGKKLLNLYSTTTNGLFIVAENSGITEVYNTDGTTFSQSTFSGNTPPKIVGIKEYSGVIYLLSVDGFYTSNDGTTFTENYPFSFSPQINDVELITGFNGSQDFLLASAEDGVFHYLDLASSTWNTHDTKKGSHLSRGFAYDSDTDGDADTILFPTTSGYFGFTGEFNSGGMTNPGIIEPGSNLLVNREDYISNSIGDTHCRFFYEFENNLYLATYTTGIWLLRDNDWIKD